MRTPEVGLFIRRIVVVAVAGGMAACTAPPAPEPPGTDELAAGRAYAIALHRRIATASSDVDAADAVAAGYLGRNRLGLGSPFRLAEYALRDPRLTPSLRRQTAWALPNRCGSTA